MYKRPLAYVCAGGSDRKIDDYMKTVFEYGWTPISAKKMFRNIVDVEAAEDRHEEIKMSKVIMRKSRIMFVCGKDITDAMKDEMVYAKIIGLTVVPLKGIVEIEEYLKGEK